MELRPERGNGRPRDGAKKSVRVEVGRRQGEPKPRPKVARKSEGPIGARKPGNEWHSDQVEQRRPVLVRTK